MCQRKMLAAQRVGLRRHSLWSFVTKVPFSFVLA